MSKREIISHQDRCGQCGAPITVEMDGLWSYRVCTRNGHVQPMGAAVGPLAGAAMIFPAR
jgi:hypothetical protein